MMNQKIAIEVKDVHKNFILPGSRTSSVKSMFTTLFKKQNSAVSQQRALRDISFTINDGEFFGIIGRNGSGKSTLLKLIAGIYQPNKGEIKVTGKLVPFIELGVGFNPELTGRENVYLNGAILGFSDKEVDAQYEEIVAFAELEKFMDQKLKNYSSGMQVRLAFACATKSQADILLVDEVLAVGDADFQRKCFEYFKQLKRQKKTVVFVTHDMNAVREYCDRVALIENSKLIALGSADDLASKYSRLFIENTNDESRIREKSKRWGDGTLSYTKIKTPSVIKDNTEVKITFNARVKRKAENVSFGFSIKDSAGVGILGTNTQISHKKLYSFKGEEDVVVEWIVPNIFRDGIYYIEPAIAYDGIVADWWEDAAHFRVLKENRSTYITDPIVEGRVMISE